MILTAKTPRFWSVTPAQMHWVGMNMRFAESKMAEAAVDPAANGKRCSMRSIRLQVRGGPRWSTRNIADGDVREALDLLTPSELYSGRGPAGIGKPAVTRVRWPARSRISAVSLRIRSAARAISRAWGTPKPTLSNSYRPELLNFGHSRL